MSFLLGLESLAGTEQMARDAHELLALLKGGEIEEGGADVAVFLLDAILLLMAHLGDVALDGVAFDEEFLGLGEVAGLDHLVGLLKETVDVVADGDELVDVCLGHGVEVVVDVFDAGLEHTLEAVDHLGDAVATEMEPGVLLDGEEIVNLTHTDDFLSSIALPDGFLVLDGVGSGAEIPDVLVHEALRDVAEGGAGEEDGVALRTAYVLAEEFPGFGLVVAAHELAEEGVDGFLFGFFLELPVVVDDDGGYGAHDEEHGDESTEMVDRGDDEAEDEGCTCRDEPSTDDGDDAGDAIDCRFASPGTVCEGGTHGDHEGHVGRGEGKLEGCSDNDEEAGEHEVDGGAHEVEGGSVFEFDVLIVETGVDPALDGGRNVFHDGVGRVEHGTHGAAGDPGGGEDFFAIVLTGEVDGCLDDFLRLLGGADGDGHDETGSDEEEMLEGELALAGEDADDVGRGVGTGVLGEVEEGLETGEGGTDEVDQVIACEGHGEGEGSEEDHELEDVDLEQVEDFHEDGEDDEADAHDGKIVGIDPVGGPSDGGEEGGVSQSADEEEEEDGGHGDASEDGYAIAEMLLIVEGEHHAGDPHDDEADDEGDGHGEEDTDDDGQGLVGVDELGVGESGTQNLRHGEG